MKRTLLRSIISITFALAALPLKPYHGLAVEIVPRAGAVSAARWRPVSPSLAQFDQQQIKMDRLLVDSQGKEISLSLANKLRGELTSARSLVQGIRQMEQHRLYSRAQWRLQVAQLKGHINRLSDLKSELEKGQNKAERDMLRLQSAMSARQTAIQLCSNMLKSLSEAQSAIVSNIK